jgi:hypothetical protein
VRDQLLCPDGLGQVVVRPALEAADSLGLVPGTGDQDHRERAEAVARANLAQRREAVEDGHVDVEEDNRDRLLVDSI